MKTTLFVILLCAFGLLLLPVSCEERSVNQDIVTDWDAVKNIISKYPSFFRLGYFDTQPDTLHAFFREIESSHADIEEGSQFHDGDPDYINLAWIDSLIGEFHYDSAGESYEKPIVFKTRTRAYLERWGTVYDPDMGWVLRRVSGTVISSSPTASRDIDELHIVSDGVDVYIYGPQMDTPVNKDSTLAFGKGKQVTFIVEPRDTTDFLFLHVKEGEKYRKIPFVREEEETFSASWTTIEDLAPGKQYYQAIVDLVSRETLVNDTTAYDAKAWGIVYRIE
jgi:hypothetical protein